MVKKLFFLIGLFLIVTIWIPSLSNAESLSISIIVNSKNPIKHIEDSELKRIFLKKKRKWSSGIYIRPICKPEDTPEGKLFLLKVMGKTIDEINKYWMLKKQTTGERGPKEVMSDDFIYRYICAVEGAIGCISSDYLKTKKHKRVKVIKVIESKAPYPKKGSFLNINSYRLCGSNFPGQCHFGTSQRLLQNNKAMLTWDL